MEICSSKFDVLNKYDKLIMEVESILSNEELKLDVCLRVFEERQGLTFEEISNRLRKKGISFEEKELYYILCFMLSNSKTIVRDEYWNKETEYRILDRNLWDSSNQISYYSFTDDSLSFKTFLLISDTHIGDDEIFDAKLLNNIYDYAIKKGATKCFHLGDLFNGLPMLSGTNCKYEVNKQLISDSEKEFHRQLEIFINEYPQTSYNELKTYCLIGNHDETINRYLKYQPWFKSCDLRNLSIYNLNFYVFPRSCWSTKLNGVDFHFNHRLYMSSIITDLKINELSDISKTENIVGDLMLDSNYNIFISGHMHTPFIYTNSDYYKQKDNLYLSVPSTSNINVGGVVGYLLYMYPESNSMEVVILGCDNDLNIYEVDRINWNFKEKNKTYRKIYK